MRRVGRRAVSARGVRGHRLERRVFLSVAWVVGLLLVFSSSASALTIGLNWDGSYNFETTRDSGASVFHMPLEYNGPGGSWSGNDHAVEDAWKNGITILPTMEAGERFLRPSDTNWSAWGTWVQEAVERYGVNGSFWNGKADPTPITAWEVWNEPNVVEHNPVLSEAECKKLHSHYYAEPKTCIQPGAYGTFLKYTAEHIQAGSYAKTAHGTNVLSGGLYARSEAEEEMSVSEGGNRGSMAITEFLAGSALTGGFSSDVTGIALHPYSLVGGATEMAHKIERIKNFLNEGGLGGLGLWLTELGWPIGGSAHFPTNGHTVTPAEQANLLTEAFNWIKANASKENIQLVAWFNMRDYPSGTHWAGTCGLLEENGNPRPSWYAFQAETGGPPSLNASPAVLHEGANWWIFYRGSDGALWQQSLVSGKWVEYRIGGQVSPGTTPTVVHEGGAWWVFYRGTDGAIHEESLVSGGEWTDYRIGGEMAWSTNQAVLHEGANWWIFYRGADGALHEESLVSGEWVDYRIGGAMAWSTSPSVIYQAGNWWVFYQGADGTLHEESLVSGGEWTDYPIAGAEMAPLASPAAEYEAGSWRVFYRGRDGALWQESLASGGEWANYRIGGQVARGTTPAITHEGGAWWIFYRGSDGALHEESLVSGGEWADYRIGSAPAPLSSPAPVHEGGAWWVFFHGAEGALWQESLVSGGEWGEYRIGGSL
jgi:hypothetical protein